MSFPGLDSHSKVGDEGRTGQIQVKGSFFGFGMRVTHGNPHSCGGIAGHNRRTDKEAGNYELRRETIKLVRKWSKASIQPSA